MNEFKKKIKQQPKFLKVIHNFEKDIRPSLCSKCKPHLDIAVRRKQNLMKLVIKQKYFCKDCANKIEIKWLNLESDLK